MMVSPAIAPLSEEVRSRLSSAREIVSPEDVVEGLVRNALDAEAHTIAIELDLAKGYISVQDDGIGIDDLEFSENGHLAKHHCTSKSNSTRLFYGSQGRFLASLSSLSLLSITSKRSNSAHGNRLVLHRGQPVGRHLRLNDEDIGLRRGGTLIHVRNLFGEIPVRSKHLSRRYSAPAEVDKTFEQIKKTLVAYLLAWTHLDGLRLSLKCGKRQYVHDGTVLPISDGLALEPTVSTFCQAGLLPDARLATWKLASIQTSELCIHAALSTAPAPSRSIQFISVGHLPITHSNQDNWLFDVINDVFQASNFGIIESHEDSEVSTTGRRASPFQAPNDVKSRRGVDHWPMFYIRIDTKSDMITQLLRQSEDCPKPQLGLEHLINALQSLLYEFLNANGFKRGRLKKGRYRWMAGKASGDLLLDTNTDRRVVADRTDSARTPAALGHWPRVKSGRSYDQHDITYGIGSLAPSEKVMAQADAGRHTHKDNGDIGQRTLSEEDHACKQGQRQETPCATSGDFTTDAETVHWRNPRDGRTLHIHPRTGALLPIKDASSLRPGLESRSAAYHNVELEQAGASTPQGNDRSKHGIALKLQKYKDLLCLRKSETSIPSMMSTATTIYNTTGRSTGLSEICASTSRSPTKEALSDAQVIGQVDQKFMLVVTPTIMSSSSESTSSHLLVLIDQHAADERVRFERLCEEVCHSATTCLTKPMVFEVDDNEVALFEIRREYFKRWGIKYAIASGVDAHSCSGPSSTASFVEIESLPPLIVERCRTDPKLLINLLRDEIWSEHCQARAVCKEAVSEEQSKQESGWISEVAHCPTLMMEMVKSRACRTAIMFNDDLALNECIELVLRLSTCVLPFQCAHGRPTLTVLGEFDQIDEIQDTFCAFIDDEHDIGTIGGDVGFRSAWETWMTTT
ncbi:hypothetical protein PV11_10216 [Exophiala sideris]|uniref:MutL C-terminal dimerisation domain-containing protein n=1 Tax=Exophiala sideris TaxID=1016849 RepID=A0A0D1WTS3_9EURO|nr:hypothetical protein PV11_10216 [Exophiala sideris]